MRVAQELTSTRIRLRRRGDTNAQADHQAATREFEGGSERLVKALRGFERVVGAADFLEEHGELVGTEPGDGVAGAERCRYPCRGRLKKGVPRRVAHAVVDRPEVIQIDDQDRDGCAAAAHPDERVRDPLNEQKSVGATCEGIAEGALA